MLAKGPVRAILLFLAAVAAVGAVAVVGYLILRDAPSWFGHQGGKLTPAQATENGGIRTATLAFFAGIVAAIGAVFTGLTFRLSRRGQGTDRFNKAIELLGHSEPNVRIGGIHALGQLARDDPRAHHRAVLEVLVSYVRDRSPWPAPRVPEASDSSAARPETPASEVPPPASLDVKAAMAVLSRRRPAYDPEPLEIDLSQTNLRAIRARGICLRQAILSDTQLQDADLTDADLYDADLVKTNLDGTILEKANLAKASLQRAHLLGTALKTAKGLKSAKLEGAIHDPLTTDWPDDISPEARGVVARVE